jgi:hypothetical protein
MTSDGASCHLLAISGQHGDVKALPRLATVAGSTLTWTQLHHPRPRVRCSVDVGEHELSAASGHAVAVPASRLPGMRMMCSPARRRLAVRERRTARVGRAERQPAETLVGDQAAATAQQDRAAGLDDPGSDDRKSQRHPLGDRASRLQPDGQRSPRAAGRLEHRLQQGGSRAIQSRTRAVTATMPPSRWMLAHPYRSGSAPASTSRWRKVVIVGLLAPVLEKQRQRTWGCSRWPIIVRTKVSSAAPLVTPQPSV